jgi:hypothetical protein
MLPPAKATRARGLGNVGDAGDPNIGLVRRPTLSTVDPNAIQILGVPESAFHRRTEPLADQTSLATAVTRGGILI